MHLSCLCPTYGRPSLVATAAKLFLNQRLRPCDTADLIVLDDANQIAPQKITSHDSTRTVWIFNLPHWHRLQLKYPILQEIADKLHWPDPDVYVIWDDDDLYLPWHLEAIATAIEASTKPEATYVHPSVIWSTYADDQRIDLASRLHQETAAGRFHGAAAVTPQVLRDSGGWCTDDAADYDQTHLRRWQTAGNRRNPVLHAPPSYVYRWGDTQRHHCSGAIAGNRYRQPPIQERVEVDRLVPALDQAAGIILSALGIDPSGFAD
jgi:hypothetical protein